MGVDIEVEPDNAPENDVGGVFWYYSCEGDEHGFDTHKIPEDVLEKIIGTGTWEETMAENGFLVLLGSLLCSHTFKSSISSWMFSYCWKCEKCDYEFGYKRKLKKH